ncbi:unnamed protein product [Ambrosiozyma monospora]|uniref:Unnamed protein product n=1 Tax=Ambrosiozyma monospora TaxID=43982 RepID=A0ACB5T0B0_AMBMO|nr:unnamed protein product [Ambrosiozyma monospora]
MPPSKSKYFTVAATRRRTRSSTKALENENSDQSFDSFKQDILNIKSEVEDKQTVLDKLNETDSKPESKRKRQRIEIKVEEQEFKTAIKEEHEAQIPRKTRQNKTIKQEDQDNGLPPIKQKETKIPSSVSRRKPKRVTGTKPKRKSTAKSKPKQQLNLPTQPPPHFWPMYNAIKEMRSKITAPVDTVGCATISTAITGLTSGPIYNFQCLISLMLSAQTKDEVNHFVMDKLHNYCKNEMGYEDGLCLDAIRNMEEAKLDELIFKVGFHKRKSHFIKQTCEILYAEHHGEIPKTIEEITAFPGVGPKMGYLLLQIAWGISSGIGVDTHMHRMAEIFNWVPKTKNGKGFTPEYVRLCLESMLAEHKEEWVNINPVLVGFGQMVCLPVAPRCDICTLSRTGLCPAVDKRLLRKVDGDKKKGVSSPQKKSRGDLSQLIRDIES